jgi:hypothetical protein
MPSTIGPIPSTRARAKPKKPYVKLESVKTIFFAKYLYLTAEGTKDYRRDEKLWTDLFLAALLEFYRPVHVTPGLSKGMPGKCAQCGSKTYLGRTTIQTNLLEIRNVPCTICQECDHEQIGYQAQCRIDKLLERAAKGKLRDRVVTM